MTELNTTKQKKFNQSLSEMDILISSLSKFSWESFLMRRTFKKRAIYIARFIMCLIAVGVIAVTLLASVAGVLITMFDEILGYV